MRILAGLEFQRSTLTQLDDVDQVGGRIGEAAWGPAQLLSDLELRLGLSDSAQSEVVRVAEWTQRLADCAPLGRFYSASFAVDPLGTARATLNLRDSLVSAGWDKKEVPGGGARLHALGELEHLGGHPPLPGFYDRVLDVAGALLHRRARPYRELQLVEPIELWGTAWVSAFSALERLGTPVGQDRVALPGAAEGSDLWTVQRLFEQNRFTNSAALRGDGSLLLMQAETSWEAAQATAALIAAFPARRTVVIREHDCSALDSALRGHGLPTQGLQPASRWRAALQLLPLTIELLFEPKDPYRVLELLTLQRGPFNGWFGRCLAEAMAEAPGIGSRAWEQAKAKWVGQVGSADVLTRLAEWVEQPGIPANARATKPKILSAIARVTSWLQGRIAVAPEDSTLLAAAAQAKALAVAVQEDPRQYFSLCELRRLIELIAEGGVSALVLPEQAGRVDHVPVAGMLRAPREHVVWWGFTDAQHPVRVLPWRAQELAALAAAGVRFPQPCARLAQRAHGWRTAIRCATRRVLLVASRSYAGGEKPLHPLWDEIVARCGLDHESTLAITMRPTDLLGGSPRASLIDSPPLQEVEPARLPGGHTQWVISGTPWPAVERYSATSLEWLLKCPLGWALRYRAGLRSGGIALPPLRIVQGQLGHRLVETLHDSGAFVLEWDAIEERARAIIEKLFECEGAIVLRSGMAIERLQLRDQLLRAVRALAALLRDNALRIVAVEHPVAALWRGATLEGRLDLLVADERGSRAIIDMKWGLSHYCELLQQGRALQLASYAFALASENAGSNSLPAAYFSLKQGKLLGLASPLWPQPDTVDGPTLEATWRRVERSLTRVEDLISHGRLRATGITSPRPRLSSSVVEEPDEDHFYSPQESCEYCDFDAICGRRWELTQ